MCGRVRRSRLLDAEIVIVDPEISGDDVGSPTRVRDSSDFRLQHRHVTQCVTGDLTDAALNGEDARDVWLSSTTAAGASAATRATAAVAPGALHRR
jgi:hypothetical protein